MNETRTTSPFDSGLLKSSALFILLVFLLIPHFRFQINPDGVSYISLAQKYIRHDFSNAVTGHWSPLFIWLLIPILITGIQPLLATKLMSFSSGLFSLFIINELLKKLKVSSPLKNISLYLFSVILTYCVADVVSPDLLFLSMTLAYLNSILSPSYGKKIYGGLICGFFGALIYLSKSYGLPFFILHFSVFSGIFIFRTNDRDMRKRIVKNYVAGMVLFLLISSCWIYVLSNKHGYITFGTAGRYGHVFRGPQSKGHPTHYFGLIPPPNETAISAWEDPKHLDNPDWSAFDSIDSLKYQVNMIKKNIIASIARLLYFSILSIPILAMAVLYLNKTGKDFLKDPIFFFLITIPMLFSGYLLLLVRYRYIWLNFILIVIIGTKLLNVYLLSAGSGKIKKTILTILFVVSFLIFPVKSIYNKLDINKDVFLLNKEIAFLNIEGKIASNSRWRDSLYLSFYNKWKYYGEKGLLTVSELETALIKEDIDYFFYGHPLKMSSTSLKNSMKSPTEKYQG
jgi:hypothetical protein